MQLHGENKKSLTRQTFEKLLNFINVFSFQIAQTFKTNFMTCLKVFFLNTY